MDNWGRTSENLVIAATKLVATLTVSALDDNGIAPPYLHLRRSQLHHTFITHSPARHPSTPMEFIEFAPRHRDVHLCMDSTICEPPTSSESPNGRAQGWCRSLSACTWTG